MINRITWFIYPFAYDDVYNDFFYHLKKFILGGFLPYESKWFNIEINGALVSQNLSFVLMIGSGLGYYLFKDD
jgi:hypothetical protein